MVTIKYATAADAENIALLSRQTFYDTFAEVNTKEDMDKFMNGVFSMDTLIKETTDPQHIFLTAFMEDQLMGYAKLTHSANPPELGDAAAIEISRIYVDKKSIGHGVGKLLMEQCIALGKEKNKQIIWLGVWEHNERAKVFYTKFGFEKFGEHDFVLGDDVQTDWLMKRDLL